MPPLLIPKSVVDRIVAGDSPLRVFRRWRGISQIELSIRTGVSRCHISDIENRRSRATAAMLKKFSKAINVPWDLLEWNESEWVVGNR